MASGLPFDDLRNLIGMLPSPNHVLGDSVAEGAARAGPGRLGSLAAWHARWSRNGDGPVGRPLLALFAGNHGHAAAGDTAGRPARTQEMVDRAAAGGMAVNGVCSSQDVGLRILDLALDLPTGDIRREAAFEERGCAATMAFGMEALAGGVDLVAVAGMGEGGEASAAALLSAMTGEPAETFVPRGQAPEDAERGFADIVDAALVTHGGHLSDPLEALRRLGGRELAAMAGLILAARMEQVPVVLGGRTALAAASVLHKMSPLALGHCVLADAGSEPGAAVAAERLRLHPLLDYRMAATDGSSAALGAGLVRTAVAASRSHRAAETANASGGS